MLRFLTYRLLYSVLIILGVVVLTFLMFRMAAGDPAAAVLGKNPKPAEIEALRRELGSDLPLFYGHWRKTEAFREFAMPAAQFPQNVSFDDLETDLAQAKNDLLVPFGKTLTFSRSFATSDQLALQLEGRGEFLVNGIAVSLPRENHQIIKLADGVETVYLTAVTRGGSHFKQVQYFRYQEDGFASQFFVSLREICSLEKSYPYVSFFQFGKTLTTREPIRDILKRGVGPSLALMTPIFLGELVLGIALALLASAFKDSVIDRGLLLISVAGMSISYLVLIIFGQWFLGYYCNFFPVWGWGSWRCLLLPVLIGVVSSLGGGVRFYRTVFVNELNKEYLRTAAAKGVTERVIFCKHLLRNTMVPIISRASTVLPFLFTGSLLLESFFGVPGLGYASIEALNNSDLQLLKALTIVNALLFVVINFLADLAYAWADPRIRLE